MNGFRAIKMMKKLLALLLLLLPLAAAADTTIKGPITFGSGFTISGSHVDATAAVSGMLIDASNAVLPDARINFGIEDASASYYTFGSGLFPSYATKTDTTASASTLGNPAITIPSGLSISAGDSIWATFVPNGAYVLTYVGTTLTMSQNATAGGGGAVTFGQNRFVAGSTTLTDALGTKVGYFGSASQGRSTWLNRYFIGSDFLTNQSLLSISPYGSYSGIFAGRSSDQAGGAGAYVIPLAVEVLQDGTGTGHSSQALYLQADLLASSTPAQHINNENSVQNGWTASADSDPFTTNPARSVFNLRLDNGKGAGSSNTATAAVDIINNGGNYLAGIIIGSDALDTSAGRLAPAMAMATNHCLAWYRAAGQKSWNLCSTAASGNGTINLTAGGATITQPLGTFTFTDPNNSRSALFGVTDGFNAVVDSAGGGSTLIKGGGNTGLSVSSSGAVNIPSSNTIQPIINATAAGTQAALQLHDNNVLKWQIVKNADNSFSLFDAINSLTPLTVSTAGNVTLGEAGKTTATSNLTVTGSFTATGLVTNADLANPATTVNGQTCTLGSSCTVTAAATGITVGTTTIGSGTGGRVLYDNAGTLGEMTTTGTGTELALSNSPVLVTPTLGVAAATSVNRVALTAPATSATLTIADGKTLTDTSGVGAVLLKGATGGGFAQALAADIPATTLATGTSVSLSAPREYYVCTSTCTVTPPVPAAGYEFCVLNDNNVATVITLAALGSSAMYQNTAGTAYGTAGTGTFISGGAVGDKVCIVGRDSTHYLTTTYNGTWVAS